MSGSEGAFSTEGSPGELRPTSAKVRKAVFDILQDRLFHSRFVDLYAGPGLWASRL